MQWDDLRIFLAVARAGSISGAARRLVVQHSTVSRRLRSLEDQLGTRLLDRRKSGFSLTEAGEDLQTTAASIEAEILEFESARSGQSVDAAGALRVTAINNMATTVLMPTFARFSTAYPRIELHLQVSNKFVSLAEREADVAIRLTDAPPETLFGKQLTSVATAVYGAHALCERINAGLEAEKWLGVECCGFHMALTKTACPEGAHNFYVDDTLLTIAALKTGAGLAYLPCFMGDSEPELTRFRQPEDRHDLGLWLLYHRDLRRTRRVRLFRDHLLEEFVQLRPLFEGKVA
jgi:Transcriptional regulator